MLEAERRGIPCIGGLLMLVAQAAQAVERYTGQVTPRERILDVTERLSHREQNIALIGMPGSGKTRVGEQIALLTGREHIDLDRALEERLGMPCADDVSAASRPSASRRRRPWPTSPSAAAWCSPPAEASSRETRTIRCCTRTARL